jgi:demethylmenaquinone methyltransferase/2-methoxy-6-polyprenyl-1,4-benzoquinol methylase
VLDAFTELAPQYEATMDHELELLWRISYREFVNRFLDTVPLHEGARILDVATGTAMIPLEVMRRVPGISHVVGLDITPAMLACGQENVRAANQSSKIRLVCGSGMTLPFGAGAFDLVTCGLGMHHIGVERLIDQMQRVLCPGGWLLLADVGAAPIWRSFLGKLGLTFLLLYFGLAYSRTRVRAEMDALVNLRTASEWRDCLAAAGFADIAITELQGQHRFYPSGLLIKARTQQA